MSEALDVYMHGVLAGRLERRSQARLRFTYEGEWVRGERQPLSLSLPVRAKPYEHEECAPFFEGLLPEGDFLKAIARTLHVSATNSFQLLTELGGECAGAISVAPRGGPLPGQDPRPPRWLGSSELAALLGDLPRRPLIAAIDEEEDGGGFRLSLAGAQDKVAVLREDGEIGLSHGHPPTTAILKAPIPHVEESVANEAFCMSMAAAIDLDVAAATPRLADGQEYLLVERFDRGGAAADGRVHQEDFCQALGYVPAEKYEKEGGPSVAQCAALIRRSFSAPARDITAFLDSLLFNFVIGNYDAHSKNYSLLLDGPGSIRMTPLYDLISTIVFTGTDRKLAMRYGGENRPNYVRGRHLDRLAAELEVKPALVRRRAIAMHERTEASIDAARRALPGEFQDRPILDRIVTVIVDFGEQLSRRARESKDTPPSAGVGVLGEMAAELGEASDELTRAFAEVNDALEQAGQIFAPTTRVKIEELQQGDESAQLPAFVSRLSDELAGPAATVRRAGRAAYDATAVFAANAEEYMRILDAGNEARSDGGQSARQALRGLAEQAEAGFGTLRELYESIDWMAASVPALREPGKDLRAGLHDLLDARTTLVGLSRHAASR